MLLFDQNISPKITRLVAAAYPGATHTRLAGLEDASDLQIFDFAKAHHLHIVTFDADFADLSVILGHPPKIIWLRTGNLTTLVIGHLMSENQERIVAFLADDDSDHGVLELY